MLINHMRRGKVVLIKLQRCFNVSITVSDGYQLRKKIKDDEKSKTAGLTQRNIFKTILRLVRPA